MVFLFSSQNHSILLLLLLLYYSFISILCGCYENVVKSGVVLDDLSYVVYFVLRVILWN